MIPNNITRKHLEKAIEEIDRDGVKKGRHSSTYDLIYNGKPYPPKLVISIANKFANNSELSPNVFGGGKGTTAFNLLKKEGFTIKEKQTKINPLYTILTKIKSADDFELIFWFIKKHYLSVALPTASFAPQPRL